MQISNFTKNYERDLNLKNYAQNTIKNYVCQITVFLRHFESKDSPKHISSDEIKDYLLTAKEVNSQRHMHSAIKLFYKYTVHQPQKFRYIEYARSEKKLPKVISKKYLIEKISAISNLKHRAILSLAYSTGMRVSEVIHLKISDIDSQRMIIMIRNSKGAKDRLVPLSENILSLLRQYYKAYHPKVYLFNGQGNEMYSEKSCNEIVKKYLGQHYYFHMLRHSCFTTMLESGIDTRIIQKIAGHNNIKTTEIYTHVSTDLLSSITLPM
jgi:site-specific recombinase XerD